MRYNYHCHSFLIFYRHRTLLFFIKPGAYQSRPEGELTSALALKTREDSREIISLLPLLWFWPGNENIRKAKNSWTSFFLLASNLSTSFSHHGRHTHTLFLFQISKKGLETRLRHLHTYTVPSRDISAASSRWRWMRSPSTAGGDQLDVSTKTETQERQKTFQMWSKCPGDFYLERYIPNWDYPRGVS